MGKKTKKIKKSSEKKPSPKKTASKKKVSNISNSNSSSSSGSETSESEGPQYKIRHPRNAYILFQMQMGKKLTEGKDKSVKSGVNGYSKMVSNAWKALDKSKKEKWN